VTLIPPQRRRHQALPDKAAVWLGLLPAAGLLIVFFGLPIAQGVLLSFSRWPGLGGVHLTGLESYRLAFDQPQIFHSLRLTFVYALVTAFAMTAIATLLAAAVSGRVRGSSFYRIVWFLPGMSPVVAVGIFWSTAMQPTTGFVNVVLGYLGLGNAHTWLAESNTAIYPCIFATVWAGAGFAFVLILGATEQVPVALYEAAELDGASAVRRFFSVTLPLIRPVVGVVGMLEFIWAANGFTLLWAMTRGGPGYATSIVSVLIYREAFVFGDYGQASAMAVMSGLVLVVVGALILRMTRSKHEGAM